MDFRILGPLEVLDEGGAVRSAGAGSGRCSRCCSLHANETLSADRLIDELWGERRRPPPAKTRAGARLAAAQGARASDAAAAARHARPRLRAAGRRRRGSTRTASSGSPPRAARSSARATAARGGDARAGARAVARAGRWRISRTSRSPSPRSPASSDLRRRGARAADRGAARSSAPMPIWSAELEALIAEHPLRERLRGAAHARAVPRPTARPTRCRPTSDARAGGSSTSSGSSPGERLRELERAILAQDPALALPVAPVAQPTASLTPTATAPAACARRRAAVRRRHLPR